MQRTRGSCNTSSFQRTTILRALIIDDERLARNALRRLLNAHPEIKVVGEAANCDDAVRAIQKNSPDLIFLDVEMPGCSGFELLEKLEDVPAVIFTTAYDEYAVRAFEVSAVDYLMKPITAERLAAALGRAQKALAAIPREPSNSRTASALHQIFVRSGERCWILRLADISLMESEGSYTRLHFGGNAPLIHRSLTAVEQRLSPTMFFRANRSQIVNLRWIEGVENDFDGRFIVKLRNGKQIEISRRQSKSLRDLLHF
jgi:two-component system, LytTR family, response regulator